MEITYDLSENKRNIEVRGLSFECAVAFEFETALVWLDRRADYGED